MGPPLTLVGNTNGGIAVHDWAGYVFLQKAKSKIINALKPRAGAEIYVALFGRGPVTCSQVIESQDQAVPRTDLAIWLHFKTCPTEFRRLLARHPVEGAKEPTAQWTENMPGAENIAWFRPQAMGDTSLVRVE